MEALWNYPALMHNVGDVRARLPLQKLIWGKDVDGKFSDL
jgi:hypothetical protein